MKLRRESCVCWISTNPDSVGYQRIQILLDTSKPLIPGFSMEQPRKTPVWVSFKYERISYVCYSCGFLGYNKKFCLVRFQTTQHNPILGLIMRAMTISPKKFIQDGSNPIQKNEFNDNIQRKQPDKEATQDKKEDNINTVNSR